MHASLEAKQKIDKLKARQELWYRGKLGWKHHAGQKIINQRFEETTRQLFVGNISRQWGKSFWAVTKAIELCLQKPRARVKYATAFHTDLVEFIIPTFDRVLGDCPSAIRPAYKVQGSKYVFANGSEIKLIGLDRNPNSLRGNILDRIIIDEAGFVSNLDYIYSSIIIPATTHRPNCKVILISTPPSTPAHAFVDFIQKAELEGGYACLDIYSNPLIDQSTIQRLMDESGGPTSSTWLREYLCKLVIDGDLAIIPEWKDEYVDAREPDVYHQFYHKYVGLDLGVSDQTAGVYGYYDWLKGQLVIEDETAMSGSLMTTEKLKTQIITKELERWGEKQPYLRVADNNNPLLLQDLSHLHGLHFMPTNKGSLEEMINAVKLMVNRGQIIVHPRCKQLIGCLKYGVWDKHRRHFARSKVYGHFDHLAALVYLVRNLNKTSNPIPQTFQVDQDNAIVFPRINRTEAAGALAQAFGFKKGKL